MDNNSTMFVAFLLTVGTCLGFGYLSGVGGGGHAAFTLVWMFGGGLPLWVIYCGLLFWLFGDENENSDKK